MRFFILFAITILMVTSSNGQTNNILTYIGVEKICWHKNKDGSCNNSEKLDPKWKWYHLNVFKMRGDSIFLEQSPIKIYKRDTSYSASDGGFYYYRGKLTKLSNKKFSIRLKEISCDYCGEPMKKGKDGKLYRIYRTKIYLCKWDKNGFYTNSNLYKQSN